MTLRTRREVGAWLAALAAAGGAGPGVGQAQSLPRYAGPWTPLFNGRDLAGWTFYQDGVGAIDRTRAVVVDHGAIHVLGPGYVGPPTPAMGHIATEREYGDYHLRLEFRWGARRYEPRLLAKRNSGLLYHMYPDRDRLWPNAVEFQIEESDVGDAILINARCWPGADLGGTPSWPDQTPSPRPAFQVVEPRPAIERQWLRKNGDFERLDGWNRIELIAIGDKAAQLVNGRIVTTLFDIVGQDRVDRNLYRPLTRGRLALEIESAEIMFRRIEIRSFA